MILVVPDWSTNTDDRAGEVARTLTVATPIKPIRGLNFILVDSVVEID